MAEGEEGTPEQDTTDEQTVPDDMVIEPEDKLQGNTEANKTSHQQPKSYHWFARVWHRYWAKKKLTIPLTIVVLVVVVMLVPFSRYKLLGLVIKRSFSISVTDSQTGKPVSDADVSLAGHASKTNNNGQATIKSKVGSFKLTVSKKYYSGSNQKILVGLKKTTAPLSVKLLATGRQVPIKISNKINGKPIENAIIDVGGTQAHTDKNGTVTVVLPANKSSLSGSLSASGYNNSNITVQITDQQTVKNDFALVPAGKVYFLSNASGKIDVVKTNLDGSDRQTVVSGTGLEDDNNTLLLASRDWKYLALKSIRQGNQAQIYIIDTSTDKLTTIDSTNADFDLLGWQDDYFMYIAYRNNAANWLPGAANIKSYNADTGKLITVDSTNAVGTDDTSAEYENFITANTHFLGGQLIYTKTWYSYPGYTNVAGQQNTLNVINPDGTGKKTISSLDGATAYFGSVIAYNPTELLVQVSQNDGSQSFYTYDSSGNYTASASTTIDDFFKTYPTYLLSPSGSNTFWSENRDGKNTLLVGDQSGANGQTVASLSELTPYGWYTDDYLLVSENSSELYIMPSSGGTPMKVSDYYKPAQNFNGYGGGYGGY